MDARPTLVLDIDGVTLDWFQPLPSFIETMGLGDADALRRFHEGMGAGMVHLDNLFGPGTLQAYHASSFGRSMPALEGAVTQQALQRFHAEHRIVALTAFSDQPALIEQRVYNLHHEFPGMFDEIRCVAAFSAKLPALEALNQAHNVVLFVDDNRKHVQEGIDVLGAEKVVWFHGQPNDVVRVAANWSELEARVNTLSVERGLAARRPGRRSF